VAVDQLEHGPLPEPCLAMLVSGGHSSLLLVEDVTRGVDPLGATIDDAAGEAFDKVARFLGLGYPGGPVIDRLARDGDAAAIPFPRAMPGELAASFSGLKTAVVQYVRANPGFRVADVAASFQEAVVDQLLEKLALGADQVDAVSLVLGGGVAANSRLRARVQELADATGRAAFLPPLALCTDNAAMIAATAYHRLAADGPTPLGAGIDPGLRLT